MPELNPSVLCPACKCEQVENLELISISDLTAAYKKDTGMNVQPEFANGPGEIRLCKCGQCKLEFFYPLISGSQRFYAELASKQLYYSTERWEFSRAKELLNDPGKSILDVGCGDGYFLSTLPHAQKMGLEFNSVAASKARSKNLLVKEVDLKGLTGAKFDVITVFHVLEHIAEPLRFCQEALALLNSKGLFVISVPNNDAFIGQDMFHAGNAPPHHVLRWNAGSLTYLCKLLPIELINLEREPLGSQHYFLYRRVKILNYLRSRGMRLPLMKRSLKTFVTYKFANLLTKLSLLVNSKPASQWREGFSILAVYQKN